MQAGVCLRSFPGGLVSSAGARKKDWVNIVFFTLTPVIGVAGTALYTAHAGFHWWMPALFLTLYVFAGVSITAGYHRAFSHTSYTCSPVAQAFFAFFGAFAAQHSILWWSAGHRTHHKNVDTDPDLYRNRIVMWQHRWHRHIMIIGGFGIPTVIGWLCGDWMAGLLWGGFLRLGVLHQTTFFVNSLAHTLGKQTYNAEVSARDNWFVAIMTFGEGYHSFHHRFPIDFRNGVRWYHWDPCKWLIRGLRAIGLAKDLRVAPPPQIEQARMQAVLRAIEPKLEVAPSSLREEVLRRLRTAGEHIETALKLWRQALEERAAGLTWRKTRRASKQHVRQSRRQWKTAVRLARRLPLAA